MTDHWTPYTTAQALLEILPGLGRLIAMRMRGTGDETDEATLMQIRTLGFIQEQPITTSELAKKRHVSLQAASVLVQNLVERGWVTRSADPTDRRQFILQITPEGLARAQATQEQVTGLLAGALDGLSPKEFEAAQVFVPGLRRVLVEQMVPATVLEK